MKSEKLKKYLFNIFLLFSFSVLSAAVAFHFADIKKNVANEGNPKPEKKTVKKSFINKKNFEFVLNWNPEKAEVIDVKKKSFIAIEELYNTNKLLVNILFLKKIKYLLNSNSDNQVDDLVDVETLLNRIVTNNKSLQVSRDYILLRLKFEQKKYDLFIADYEKIRVKTLKKRLTSEYISCLLNTDDKKKAIDIFKGWYLTPLIKISKLESLITKKKLKVLFKEFSTEDWIKSFIFFVNEDKQGTLKKLSGYAESKQITALFLAEYNYVKKEYSRAKNHLKKVKDRNLLGFKKRILYKIMLRGEKYELLLSQIQELSGFPKAYKGFLLNAAKLSMKNRPDLSKILFEKYLALYENEPIEKKSSETEISEYWRAIWRLTWFYYRDGDIDKVKILLKESFKSEFISYRIASEYWLSALEKRNSAIIEKFPFSYYYITYLREKKNRAIKSDPDSFNDLFPKRKTVLLDKILKNIEILLKYGLVNECIYYIDGEIKNSPINITERNFLRFIPLILAIKEGKYGKVIWRYRRSFENYRSIQLPKYFREIVAPVQYSELIYKYSNNKQIDPHLVMALIKQESSFNSSVVSPSKAYGLMQLILKTANLMAKKYKRRVYRANLFTPEINIKYGVEYLKGLIDKYKGNIYYALAAYNAGDHRVDNWLPQMGNVTNEEFVEMIPFTETRNYVKLVIRNYHYYKFYYNPN